MATYIPGVEDKIPQSQPFVPDYKFLSDVLHTRQDRFDKNYKQLNDVYGKVVYADLTRNDNKYVRDQYAEQLAPQIKQISGLDLSLQENVDAAYGLFKPFYEDKQVIKDLTATATLKQQRKKMSSFKDSSIREVREKYWDYGRQGLDIWQEDFKNADPQKALGMGLPQYIEDVDLVEQAMILLDNSELGDTTSDVDVSQDNKWLITLKSGSLITAAPTGRMIEVKDSKGKVIMVPETENLALNHVKDRLMDDPKVQAAYHLRNFVDMRNYVKEKSEELGGDDAAKKAWATETMEKYKTRSEEDISNLSKVKETKKIEVSSWEAYANKIGIEPGSENDVSFLNSMDELELINKVITSQTQRLQDATAPTDDIKNLLNKAYSLAMGTQMGDDMLTSASAYAKKTQTREIEPNPNYTAWVEHQYAMARIKYKEASDAAKEEKESVSQPIQVPIYRYKAGDKSTTGKNTTSDPDQNLLETIINGDDATSDAIAYNNETTTNDINYNVTEQKRILKQVYLANAQDLNLDPSKFTPIFSPDLMVGTGKLEIGEIYYPDEVTLDNGMVNKGIPQEYGTGVIGEMKMLQEKIVEENKPIAQRLVNYPKSTSMTWNEFNDIEDSDQIHDMYMNMLNFIDNADNYLPSYMTLDTKTKSDIAYSIYNLRGNMSMFNEGVDKMAANYMQVQQHLVGTDEDFKYAAQDGGSIFNNDGILIDREEWKKRYVDKWTKISNAEIRSNMTQQNFQGEQFLPPNMLDNTPDDILQAINKTKGDGTNTLPAADADLNQMQIINEEENQINVPWSLTSGKYWQANMMGTEMPGGNGIQEYHITTPQPRFDQIQNDADLYYDYMYAEINKKMTKDGENAAEFGFNLSAQLNGQPETIGGDLFQSGEHQFKFDENASTEVNAPSVDFANQVLEILDGDPSSFSVYAGGNIILEKGEILGVQNPEMMNVIQQWYYSMGDNYGNNKADGGGAPKADGLDFSISYAKNRGGSDADVAGYEIHIGTDWANSSVLGRYDKETDDYITGMVTEDKSKAFLTDNVITILFDKALDNNKYKTGDKETQWVMNELSNNDGRIVRNVPGAGTITIFSTGDGRYMYSEQLIQYEGNKKIPFAGQQIEIPASQIANVLATQQQRLTEMGTANMEQLKAYNISNKIIQ